MKIYLLAFLLSLLLTVALGFIAIPFLKRIKAGQSILSYVKEHQGKNGTPTMGGLFFIIPSIIVGMIFANKCFLFLKLSYKFW